MITSFFKILGTIVAILILFGMTILGIVITGITYGVIFK